MTSKYFVSIGFSVCALIFVILVAIMYITKRKQRKTRIHNFSFLLGFTIILLLTEIAYVTCMDNMDSVPVLTSVFCHLYLIEAISWIMSLLYYIIKLGTEDYEEEKKNSIRKRSFIFLIVIVIITGIVSCLLPIEYNTAVNDIYVFSGPASYFVYIVGFSSATVMFLIALIKHFKFSYAKKIPVIFAFTVVIVFLTVQIITGYDFNTLTYLFTFVIATLFFTVESQDSKLLAEVKESKEAADKANKAKTEFLESMSHEIRTPMSTILGFSESLLRQKELSQETVKEDVESIHDASVSLLALINSILDISRLESDRESLVEKEYNLQDLVLEIEEIFSSKTNNNNNKDLTFVMKVDSELPKRFFGDYQKISKAVVNILMNALKYTVYGKITLEFLLSENTGDYNFKIIVSNTGHEMKEEYLNFDFNDFVKIGDNTNGSNIDSITIGLSVAKQYIKMMGGRLDFRNEPGHGTQYLIYLHQKVVNEEKIGDMFSDKSKNSFEEKTLDLSGKRILIVDDNLINIKIAKRFLEVYKINIDDALSGQECIDKVKDTNYDLIFLDHMMPEMDGVDTLNELKKIKPELPPVIALTANSYSGTKEKYLEEGFNDYLAKPINNKDLNRIMNDYFNGGDE